MKKMASLILFLFLSACATNTPHTYLKYSGYIDGCADMADKLIQSIYNAPASPTIREAMCMELYLIKLEAENIKPPMKRLDRNEIL